MLSPPPEAGPSWTQALLQRAETLSTAFVQIFIIAISSVVLLLGIDGRVLVSEDALFLKEGYVGFAVGIAVQIALIAPLELCRTICKIWFWKRLVVRGENLRSLVCTWSVIYSNSYRGAEDLLQGIGPISGLLMLVYVIEVGILGAIGSLYTTESVSTLKAQGELPMLRPFQSTTKDTDDMFAHEAIIPAELSFFSFAKIYDPLVIQGIETNNTCEPASRYGVDTSSFASTWRGCGSVVASPLTTPRLAIAKTVAPPAVNWTTMVEGDILRSRATEIFTTVECGPSDDLVATDMGFNSYYLAWNNNATSTTGLWAATASFMTTPQVTIAPIGTGSVTENPIIDKSGGMLFAVVAFNFDNLDGMTKATIPLYDVVVDGEHATRDIGFLLCRARFELATVTAEHEILQVEPGLVTRLNYADADSERIPYSMDPSTPYGYSVGMFLIESLFMFTCDYLPCPTDSNDPPVFDQTIGLVDAQQAADGTISYALNFSSMTTNIAKLFSRNLLSYAAVPRYREGIPANLLSTHAELWKLGHTKRIFTTAACNVILSIGIISAAVLVTLSFLQEPKGGAMGGSVLQLLDAIGWRKMPNMSSEEWRAAGVAKLRQRAHQVLVKGALDGGGKAKLSLSSEKKLANLHVLSDSSLKLTHRTKSDFGAEISEPTSQRVAQMDPGEV
ncbi:hypothetical protein BDZ88DRAFT_416727 [Geranomyces variabilis]|nr:hypothetical protein BDZ88DRAFT_416727 [Geranomyces variabilis]